MSSMPGRGTSGQTGGRTEAPEQRPAGDGRDGTPGGGFGGQQPGWGPQSGYAGDRYGAHWGGQGFPESPVDQRETNVVGRRVVQYVIDYVLAGIIPGIAVWVFDRGHGFLHGLGWLVATAISLLVYLWYWVLRPNSHQGQTIGMQLLGLRIISKNGGPANIAQYFVRAVLLLIDTFAFGLVGLASMVFSRYHQRVGDHMARTLVVAADQPAGGPGGPDGPGGEHRFGADDERLARPGMEDHNPYGHDPYGQGGFRRRDL